MGSRSSDAPNAPREGHRGKRDRPDHRRSWPPPSASAPQTRRQAAKAFELDLGGKWPKATAKITYDLDELLSFYDFPLEHWIHLRTSNPIESTFSTVRLRTRATKGPGSKAARLAMPFKLMEAAEERWRSVNAPHLVALVRAGAKFEKGVMVERAEQSHQEAAA